MILRKKNKGLNYMYNRRRRLAEGIRWDEESYFAGNDGTMSTKENSI